MDSDDWDSNAYKAKEGEDTSGKQGFVSYVGDFVEKRSQYNLDYTIEVEVKVGHLLNTLHSEHFCKYYGLCCADPPTLRMERITGQTFVKCVLEKPQAVSVLGRTLAAMAIVNEELNISHNDLHRENVIVRQTDVDIQAYIYPDGEELAGLTYGMSPVIIDFGLASSDTAFETMQTEVMFTDVGYFPHEMDKLSDSRRLLGTCKPHIVQAKSSVHCASLEFSGIFGKGTFPRMIDTLMRQTDMPRKLLHVLVAHIKFPLGIVKSRVPLKTALSKLDPAMDAFDIKQVLDGNKKYLRPKYSVNQIRRARKHCKAMILALNNSVHAIATECSTMKNALNLSTTSKCSRDVARILLSMEPPAYVVGSTVSIYRVADRTTKIVKITAVTGQLLRAGKTLSEVFP